MRSSQTRAAGAPFEFATAARIVFGAGALREIAPLARQSGSRALVVTGRDPRRAEPLLALLRAETVDAVMFPVPGEPSVDTVRSGVERARRERCDFVIGFGGGSAIDAGKAIAALLPNEGDLFDYLEVIGRSRPLTGPSAVFLAIPTTAGTGAEVTRNAVLASPEHRVKVSLRSPFMLPRVALVDPELTRDLPPGITATTGLDALTQLIEPFVCLRANPITDGLCVEGMKRVSWALRAAWANGRDTAAREAMSVASLFGGMALANAGLGAVHGLAGPMGGMFPAPHGAVCAALLPQVMDANLRSLRERDARSDALRRYAEVARVLTGNPAATADDGAEWVRTLVLDLHVPRLGAYGIGGGDIGELVEKAAKASSMKANPVVLTADELKQIVERAV